MTYNETAVAVFCKAPIPGNVKQRLAADLGQETAAAIYRCCAEHVIWNVRHAGLDTVLFVDREDALPAFHDWVGGSLALQRGDDLGARMSNAVEELRQHGYGRVIIVGTDAPFIEPETLRDATLALMTNDVVLGPAFDGGYYLIGMNGQRPELFQDIAWSTNEVFNSTVAVCTKHGWSVAELDPLQDIDTAADLKAVMAEAPQGHDDFLRRCHLILRDDVTG